MLALAILAAAALFGAGVVRRLGWSVTRVEALGLGAAAALTVAPWILLGAAAGLGFTAGLPVAAVALAAAGLALGRGRPRAAAPALPAASLLSWGALAAVLAVAFHGHMLHAEAGGLYTGGASYGDLALHATLVNHFAEGSLGFDSPLVAGAPLTYPFLGDFLVACLVRGGLSISTAFALTGWLSALAGLALFEAVAVRMFRARAAGVIAVWLVVLSGSAGGIYHLVADLARHGWPSDLGALPSYAHDRERGLVWSNLVADFVLPQRGFVAALPAAWAAIWAMRGGLDDGDRRAPWVAGVALGLMPFFHVHTFLVGAGLLGWIALWQTARAPRQAARWWLALAVAVVLAAPQLAWQFGGSWHTSFGRWRTGWIAPDGGWWWFWLRGWGVVLAVVPVIAVTTWRRGAGHFGAPLLTAAVIVFAACNLYQFQPHDWDNMKFLLYAFMFVVVLAAGVLAALLARPLGRAVAAVAIAGATLAGAATLVRELDRHDQLASRADLEQAARLRAIIPPGSRVLTSDQHNHVVPMLTGRAIVMGYRGWLWTHGIDVAPLQRDVVAMFAGGAAVAPLLRRHGVTHVYIGPGEQRDLGADPAWYRARYPVVYARDGVEVFDVRAPLPTRTARS